MNNVEKINRGFSLNRKKRCYRLICFFFCIVFIALLTACQSDPYGKNWHDENNLTICQYLEKHQQEYSKSYNLLVAGKMFSALCAYNPYGNDYTLFLPTNEAIDQFVEQNPEYDNFEQLLQDTSFVKTLTRYHTLKSKVHTDEFPDGALLDSTFTGDRLSFGFYSDGENQLIKVNKTAPIINANLEMTNGYIHVISKVLEQTQIEGFDWLQEQKGYSILANAMIQSGIKKRIWWKKYTILAEHDSIYHKMGIYTVQDLRDRIAKTGSGNNLNKFAGYHIIGGEYYLNDFVWGSKKYWNLGGKPLIINVGYEIKINPGVDIYRYHLLETGETIEVDYILPLWDESNIRTSTGPVHSITDVMFYAPLSEE